MGKELIYNGIEFTSEFIIEVLIPQLPDNYVNFWDIKYNSKTGGIRFCKDKVESIYLFVSIKGIDESILKFVKSPHINHFEFDSLYVGFNINGEKEYDDYRYNINNEVIATYNFLLNENGGHFCNQFKDGVLLKKYITNNESFHPYVLQQMIDEGVITDFDVNTTTVDGFHVSDDIDTVYYFIR
jgi:hypothetical protein